MFQNMSYLNRFICLIHQWLIGSLIRESFKITHEGIVKGTHRIWVVNSVNSEKIFFSNISTVSFNHIDMNDFLANNTMIQKYSKSDGNGLKKGVVINIFNRCSAKHWRLHNLDAIKTFQKFQFQNLRNKMTKKNLKSDNFLEIRHFGYKIGTEVKFS